MVPSDHVRLPGLYAKQLEWHLEVLRGNNGSTVLKYSRILAGEESGHVVMRLIPPGALSEGRLKDFLVRVWDETQFAVVTEVGLQQELTRMPEEAEDKSWG